jgi:hypothetical protein
MRDGSAKIETLVDISHEVERGRAKFPGGRFLLAALGEEVGELALAVVSGDAEQIRLEAIQCAAVAVRIIEEGERTAYQRDGLIECLYAVGGVARGLLQRDSMLIFSASRALLAASTRMSESVDRTFDDLTDEESNP